LPESLSSPERARSPGKSSAGVRALRQHDSNKSVITKYLPPDRDANREALDTGAETNTEPEAYQPHAPGALNPAFRECSVSI